MSPQPADPRSRPARGTGEILVTGSTGFLGREVCRQLSNRERRFRALVRIHSNREVLRGTGAWMTEGDLTDRDSLDGPMEGVHTVLHLGALVRNPDPAANRSVNVDGTRNVLEAAEQAGVQRVIAVSSDSVLRGKRSPYAETKAEAEALVLTWGRGTDRSSVVLRPPLILGAGSSHLASLERLSRVPFLPLPSGSAPRCPVWVGDVASALLRAIELPSELLPEQAIDLPGDSEVSLGEIVRAIARAHNRREPRIHLVSEARLRSLARLGGSRLSEIVEGLGEHVTLDPSPARDLLDWQPLCLDELIDRCIGNR
ncbi:MAG: NAD(P)-dependent oxidoreductase [Myxococcota bacterium]|nr:NAD(P)-dependent oxidoreductase [Myxococcota bacterium]